VAALLAERVAGKGPACAIVSGGNIDATLLGAVIRHGLTQASRFLVLRTRIGDRPGALAKLLALIADERVNVLAVEHHREGMSLPLAQTEVELTLGTRDEDHCRALLARLADWGYEAERLR
jgi:threonine dehydratase